MNIHVVHEILFSGRENEVFQKNEFKNHQADYEGLAID